MEIIFSLLFILSTAFGSSDVKKDVTTKTTIEQTLPDTGDTGGGSGGQGGDDGKTVI